jgi:dephospho-CoA kinase
VKLFGLTGGIASGKSAVASRWRARGLPVVDADLLAREAVAPHSSGLEAIVARFGPDVLAKDGSLDRKRLADVVFASDDSRSALNAIVHPIISKLTFERAAELASQGEPLACYEAALLVENGLADAFRPLVVVSVPEDIQVARAMVRDRASAEDARARIRAQLPLATKVSVADHVIDNSGTLTELHARADAVLRAICDASGVEFARYPAPTSPA